MREAAIAVAPDRSAALPNLDSIIRGLLCVYLFSLPFKALLFFERNGFIILIVLLVLWCAVNQRHFFSRTPIDLPLIAFVLWVGFTIPFAASPEYSVKEFAKLLKDVLLFYVVVHFFRLEGRRARLLWVFVGGLFVISAYGIYQYAGLIGAPLAEGELMLVESVTPGEVWLTTYLVMTIPLGLAPALFLDRRPVVWGSLAVTVLATVCLLLTYSRAGVVALVCEGWALTWILRPRIRIVWTVLFTVLILAGSVLLVRSNLTAAGLMKASSGPVSGVAGSSSFEHRLQAWRFVGTRIAEHWFVGMGYGKGTLEVVYAGGPGASKGRQSNRFLGTHNTFLDVALGVGLPGLGLFVWLLARLLSTILSEFDKANEPVSKAILLGVGVGGIGLIVRLLFDHMLIGTLAVQFWVLVALAVAAGRSSENESPRSVSVR